MRGKETTGANNNRGSVAKKIAKNVAIGAAVGVAVVSGVKGAEHVNEIVRNRSLAVHIQRGEQACKAVFQQRNQNNRHLDSADAILKDFSTGLRLDAGLKSRERSEWKNESFLDALKTSRDFGK